MYHEKFIKIRTKLIGGYLTVQGSYSSRENVEISDILEKIKENLENSGNFLIISTTSGKNQGTLFCQTSLINQVVLSE